MTYYPTKSDGTPFSGHGQYNKTGKLKRKDLRKDLGVFSLQENNPEMQNMKTALHGFEVRKLHS